MPHLSDTQRVLLSHAAQQSNASLCPIPASLSDAGARVARAIISLTKLALIEERETSNACAVHRIDGDLRHGLFITPAGLAAIGISDGDDSAVSAPPAPARASKSAAVIELLLRKGGATTPELIDATGWLPHTTRAALTGLRKKGHTIERSKRDDATCYRIVAAA